jgi:hypothetical protein
MMEIKDIAHTLLRVSSSAARARFDHSPRTYPWVKLISDAGGSLEGVGGHAARDSATADERRGEKRLQWFRPKRHCICGQED